MTEPAARLTGPARILIVTAVLVALVGVVVWKGSAGASLTSGHNDAVADFGLARKSGKPIYVLFHSLS